MGDASEHYLNLHYDLSLSMVQIPSDMENSKRMDILSWQF